MDGLTEEFIPLETVRTPVEITNQMQWALFYQRKAIYVIHELRVNYFDAKNAYDEVADVFKRDNGQLYKTVSALDAAVRCEFRELYNAVTDAKIALDHAIEKLDHIEKTLSASQTETRLVIAEMQMSGHGGA